MGEAELRVNQSRQTALDEGILSPKQEGEKICRQGLDNSGNIEALPVSYLYHTINGASGEKYRMSGRHDISYPVITYAAPVCPSCRQRACVPYTLTGCVCLRCGDCERPLARL
jgi:hypothetical protein